MVDGLPELQRPFGDREWIPVGKSRMRLALTAQCLQLVPAANACS